MNYYEHHIRDYDAATAHLTWDEDLAYTRLLRWYYRKEQAIPADIKEACRQVRATTKVQRDAVAAVLREFFDLREDGWHQRTCDEAIAAYQASEPEREARKRNEDTRMTRHRQERAELFAVINGAGMHMAWNTPIAELRATAERIRSGSPATPATGTATDSNAPATQPATATATPATATQYPPPNTHPPVELQKASTQPPLSPVRPESRDPPSAAGALCIAMRAEGIEAQPHDPRVMALAEQGVSSETVAAACREAKATKPGERVPFGYVVGIVERWARDAKRVNGRGAKAPSTGGSSLEERNRAVAANWVPPEMRKEAQQP